MNGQFEKAFILKKKMMKFFRKRPTSGAKSESVTNCDSSQTALTSLSDSGSRVEILRNGVNDSGSSVHDSVSIYSRSGSETSVARSNSSTGLNNTTSLKSVIGPVTVHIYTEDLESMKKFVESESCETICTSLAEELGITPTMSYCFSLAVYDVDSKKAHWLDYRQQPGTLYGTTLQKQEKEIHFRMRFIPNYMMCKQLGDDDPACLRYLMWQVKWDFLHSSFSCFYGESKTDEARGFCCMIMLLAMRLNTEKVLNSPDRRNERYMENIKVFMRGRDLDHFLPSALRKRLIEKKILGDSIYKKVQVLQETHPYEACSSIYLLNWCLQVILRQNLDYYTENFVAFLLDIDSEEFETIDEEDEPSQIVEKHQLEVFVTMQHPVVRLMVKEEQNSRIHLDCKLENIGNIEINEVKLDGATWWKLYLFRQDGHPMLLYFKDRDEVYSFASCIESYFRLIYDFYDSVCRQVEPTRIQELNLIRAHGPVRDNTIRRKLKKKNSGDLYVLRMNLKLKGSFDMLYLRSKSSDLKKETLPQIQKVDGGYRVVGTHEPPQELKVLLAELIKKTNLIPSTCWSIKPQNEGCDILQSLLTGEEPRDLDMEDEERREKRKVENQPKVYCKADLELTSCLGQGHFTEVYSGILNGQDEVVVKQLRALEIPDQNFRDVQEAFHEGIEKLQVIGDPQYFVGFLGISLLPSIKLVMRRSNYGSLRRFLQIREQGLPMLSLHHLLDTTIQIASAVVFMEENECYHGNLHCDNISVLNFDHRDMVVRITDPGLVSLYNKLPLHHDVNKNRLAWLAPELHTDLSKITSKTEVYAFATTIWQMFSQGDNPVNRDMTLKDKTIQQMVTYLAGGGQLHCPQLLHIKNVDPPEVKEVKDLIYKVMKSCWPKYPQERANPKKILRDLNCNIQTYEETYHKYNIIPYFDAETSAVIYSRDSASVGLRTQESGFVNSDPAVLVPDISCLHQEVRAFNQRHTVSNLARDTLGPNLFAITPDPARPAPALRVQIPAIPQSAQVPSQIRTGATAGHSVRIFTGQPSPPILPYSIEESRLEIDKQQVLGKGHYGAVYLGKLKPRHIGEETITIVVKVLKPEMVTKYSEDFKKEAQLMNTLEHPNVVKFYGICRQGEYLVMEYVENNSLHRYISNERNRHKIRLATFLQFALDIASGMEYLECKKVLHCDLAARNILLCKDLHAKISDFGLSKILSNEKDYYRRTSDKNIPILWCAPEWIGFKRFTSKSDVWSYGVVLWEMFSYGKPPYINKSTHLIMNSLLTGERLKKPSQCPDEVYSLMLNCWEYEPTKRLTFTQLKERFIDLARKTNVSSSTNQDHTTQASSSKDQAQSTEAQSSKDQAQSTAPSMESPSLKDEVQSVEALRSKDEARNTKASTSNDQAQFKRTTSSNNQAQIIEPSSSKDQTQTANAPSSDDQSTKTESSKDQAHSTESQSSKNQAPSTEAQSFKSQAHKTETQSLKDVTHTTDIPSFNDTSIIIHKRDLFIDKTKLGEGAFGIVYKAQYKGQTVAVKDCKAPTEYDRFSREFRLLYELKGKSPNIVNFIGLCLRQDTGVRKEYMYLMEFMEGGCLHTYLVQGKKDNKVGISRKLNFLLDIAKGMDFLFKQSIVHCDLTAKNVLLSKDLTAKISDFGWAKKLESLEDNTEYKRENLRHQIFWSAPEVFERQVYTKFSDIWSYGVVCIEVFRDGDTPCLSFSLSNLQRQDELFYNKFFHAILKGERFPRPDNCPPDLYQNMILKCWQKDYKTRISFSSIVEEISRYVGPDHSDH